MSNAEPWSEDQLAYFRAGMAHDVTNTDRWISTLDARDETIAELKDLVLDAGSLLREYMPDRWQTLHDRIDAALAGRTE